VDESVHLLCPPLFIEKEMSIGGFPIDGHFLLGVKKDLVFKTESTHQRVKNGF